MWYATAPNSVPELPDALEIDLTFPSVFLVAEQLLSLLQCSQREVSLIWRLGSFVACPAFYERLGSRQIWTSSFLKVASITYKREAKRYRFTTL
jgi:hypothetical protein